MIYNVLKEWGAYPAGSQFDDSTVEDGSFTPEVAAELEKDGTLAPVVPTGAVVPEAPVAPEAPVEPAPEVPVAPEASAPEVPAEPAPVASEVPVAPAEKVLTYQGKVVISTTLREVNGVTYEHIRLADGSEMDVSGDEYAAIVAAS